MKLLTKELKAVLPKLYSQDGKGDNAICHIKFFTPWSGWTWYGSEFDGKDTFFGKVVSPMEPDGELGYFSLSELTEIVGPAGLKIERDMHWGPKPLRECE